MKHALKYLIEYVKSNFSSKINVIDVNKNICNNIVEYGNNEVEELTDKQKKKLELIRDVKEYYNKKNFNIRQIANTLKLDSKTVKRYIEKSEINIIIRNTTIPKTSKLDKYKDTIVEMYNNNYTVTYIYISIALLGYNGCYSNLKYYINSKKVVFNTTKYNKEDYNIITHGDIIRNIWRNEFFTDNIETIFNEKSSNYKQVREIIKNFRTIVKEKSYKKVDCWINEILNLRISQFRSFANGLLKDIEAVKNAIKYDYSNGSVEGHVNRLKVIKRIMYGRANFDLLRIKCLYKI